MPRWLARFAWRFRRRRRVAVHLDRPLANGGSMTYEGIRVLVCGDCVVLRLAALLQMDDSQGTIRKVSLDCYELEIPRERVLATEVFGR